MDICQKILKNRMQFIYFVSITVFVFFAIYGGIHSYSSVLFWDSWGTLITFEQFSSGHLSVLWDQHNEHRIVLARLLFMIDYAIFNGDLSFLIILNYFFAIIICLVLAVYCFRLGIKDIALPCFIICSTFSWANCENFTWEFQSQFFLAQLLPLAAFYFLCRAHGHRYVYFLTAVCLGVINIGTMANCILLFPLMTVYALMTGFGKGRISILAFFSFITTYVYLIDYNINAHGNLFERFFANPVMILGHFISYLGSPIKFLFQSSSIYVAILGGFLFLFLLFLSCQRLHKRYNNLRREHVHIYLGLVFFIFFIVGSAGITSLGRAQFGLEQALSSRYMLPMIMAWCALSIVFTSLFSISQKIYSVFFLVIMVLMLPAQVEAFYKPGYVIQRQLAALALNLDIHDQDRIEKIYPNVDALRHYYSIAQKYGLKVSSPEVVSTVSAALRTECTYPFEKMSLGIGSLDVVQPIKNDENWLSAIGWVYGGKGTSDPQKVYILDGKGKVIGGGLTGIMRPDVANAVGRNAVYSGFQGYLKNVANKENLFLYLPDSQHYVPVILNISGRSVK